MLYIIGACGEYGVGELSECTDGFPSLFHIDYVEDMTTLETRDRRQVLIPDINFTCDGTITKWIFGAEWKGNTDTYTELQVWRRTDNVYTRVRATTITVAGENTSQVYEYPLDLPLEFREGDILGYFQAFRQKSQLNLYLEESERLTTYHMSLGNNGNNDVDPPATGDRLTLSRSYVRSLIPTPATSGQMSQVR